MFEFKQFSNLTNGDLTLVHDGYLYGEHALGQIPAYKFRIMRNRDRMYVGDIDIRIGITDDIQTMGGQLGYGILPYCRGHNYAAIACLLVQPVAKSHGMTSLWITCNHDNIASHKTCQHIGAVYVDTVEVPQDHELYLRGDRWKSRYLWQLETE